MMRSIVVFTIIFYGISMSIYAQNVPVCPNLSDSAILSRYMLHVDPKAHEPRKDSIKFVFQLADSLNQNSIKTWAESLGYRFTFSVIKDSKVKELDGIFVIGISTNVKTGDFSHYTTIFRRVQELRSKFAGLDCGIILQK